MLTPFAAPVYVTKPFLPPLEAYQAGVQEIWANEWLTNSGPLLHRYLRQLTAYLDVPAVSLFVNGTLALQLGLRALGLTGEVITTPFTFIATGQALEWNGLRPVYADIEPSFYTLDPARVEAAITPQTAAILAVHVFGAPCHLNALAAVAWRHGLPLIYDCAHAFGVTVNGTSLARFGDLSMYSLHATKPCHAIEGGILVSADPDLSARAARLANFGFEEDGQIRAMGTNAKMSEFQALMGLLVLPYLSEITARRAAVAAVYRERLSAIRGLVVPPPPPAGVQSNYAYAPIEVDETVCSVTRDDLYRRLQQYNVFARRYFYPLLPECPYPRAQRLADALPVARRVADRILCLPLHHGLTAADAQRICDIIGEILATPTLTMTRSSLTIAR
jgi:dTDP-4-amino-4,6-dideoxygalactose transaminase